MYSGMNLATSSGDGTIKIWDFAKGVATETLREHTQPVWSCNWNDSGLLLSTSMDTTVKIWDVEKRKCIVSIRGHEDSVNDGKWKQGESLFITAGSDGRVCLWDIRQSVSIATFQGNGTVNAVAYSKLVLYTFFLH
jgi:WD40 repeat protein